MGIKEIKVITCDHCGRTVVDERYVDASTYGVAFDVECWENIGGPRVARVLYLDEIYIKDASGQRIENAWGPR